MCAIECECHFTNKHFYSLTTWLHALFSTPISTTYLSRGKSTKHTPELGESWHIYSNKGEKGESFFDSDIQTHRYRFMWGVKIVFIWRNSEYFMNRAWLSDMCVVCQLLWYIVQHWVSGLIVKWRIFLKTMMMTTNYDHDDYWIAELEINLFPRNIAGLLTRKVLPFFPNYCTKSCVAVNLTFRLVWC